LNGIWRLNGFPFSSTAQYHSLEFIIPVVKG